MNRKPFSLFRKVMLLLACLAAFCLFNLYELQASEEKIKTSKLLLPYDDLLKLIQNQESKYFILPLDEYEAMLKAKEEYLKTQKELEEKKNKKFPLDYQVTKLELNGRVGDYFADLTLTAEIEKHSEQWLTVPLLSDRFAVTSIKVNGQAPALAAEQLRAFPTNQQQIQITPRQRSSFNYPSRDELLSLARGKDAKTIEMPPEQPDWYPAQILLPLKEKGKYLCEISFVTPITLHDNNLSEFSVKLPSLPNSQIELLWENKDISFESISMKSYEKAVKENGLTIKGWFDSSRNFNAVWREKLTASSEAKKTQEEQRPEKKEEKAPEQLLEPTKPEVEPEPQTPLIFADTQTYVELGDTSCQVTKSFAFKINRAPVKDFYFYIPESVTPQIDLRETHSVRVVQRNDKRMYRVTLNRAVSDSLNMTLSYSLLLDRNASTFDLQEIIPADVERELGNMAVFSGASLEIKAQETLKNGVFEQDPSLLPREMLSFTNMPILLAFRHTVAPLDLTFSLKRYKEIPQTTVTAERVTVVTAFNTNKTASSLIDMVVKNNNSQYLTLKLNPGEKIIYSFVNEQPVSAVLNQEKDAYQIPLEMPDKSGVTLDNKLEIRTEHEIDALEKTGNVKFKSPLYDLDTRRFNWHVYGPETFRLYGLEGNMTNQRPYVLPSPLAALSDFFTEDYKKEIKDYYSLSAPFIHLLIYSIVIFILFFFVILPIINFFVNFRLPSLKVLGSRLIEIIIVVGVIVLLAYMATPNFSKSRSSRRYDREQAKSISTFTSKDLESYTESYTNESAALYEDWVYGTDSYEEYSSKQSAPMAVKSKAPAKVSRQLPPGRTSKPVAITSSEASSRAALPVKTSFPRFGSPVKASSWIVSAALDRNSGTVVPEISVNYIHKYLAVTLMVITVALSLLFAWLLMSGLYKRDGKKLIFAVLVLLVLFYMDYRYIFLEHTFSVSFFLSLNIVLIVKFFFAAKASLPGVLKRKPKILETSVLPETDSVADLSEQTIDMDNKSGKTNIGFLFTLFVLILLLSSIIPMPLRAEDAQKEITVLAPFKDLTPLLDQGDKVVIIPEKDYDYLKDLGEKKPEEEKSPNGYLIKNVFYFAETQEKGIKFTALINLELYNEGYKTVPLISSDLSLLSATDGINPIALYKPADNPRYLSYITDKQGSEALKLEFFIPYAGEVLLNTKSVRFETPLLPMAQLQLKDEGEDRDIWVNAGSLISSDSKEGYSTFQVALAPASFMEIKLFAKAPSIPLEKPNEPAIVETVKEPEPVKETLVVAENPLFHVKDKTGLIFKDGFVEGLYNADIETRNKVPVASLTVLLPKGVVVPKVECSTRIERWEAIEEDGLNKLNIFFNGSYYSQNINLKVYFEEILDLANETRYELRPFSILGMESSSGFITIAAIPSLQVALQGTVEALEAAAPSSDRNIFGDSNIRVEKKIPFSFVHYGASYKATLKLSRPVQAAQRSAAVQEAQADTFVTKEGAFVTSVYYEVYNNSLQFLEAALPEISGYSSRLLSTAVDGETVAVGGIPEMGHLKIPIIRSQEKSGKLQPFTVMLTYLAEPLAENKKDEPLNLKLPQISLPIEELRWKIDAESDYVISIKETNMEKTSDYRNNTLSLDLFMNYTDKQKIAKSGMSRSSAAKSRIVPVFLSADSGSNKHIYKMTQIKPEGEACRIALRVENARSGKNLLLICLLYAAYLLLPFAVFAIIKGCSRKSWFVASLLSVLIIVWAKIVRFAGFAYITRAAIVTSIFAFILFFLFYHRPKYSQKPEE